MLVDTHAHLFWDSYTDDLDQVVQNASDAGVKTIVNVGVDLPLSQKASDMESPNSNVKFFSSIAIHPEEAVRYAEYLNPNDEILEDTNKLADIYKSNPAKVVAVGECGLDFAYFNQEGYVPNGCTLDQAKELQIQLFQSQIDLAKKLQLPLLIHCRDDREENPENTECWDMVIDMTKNHFGIYHCYSGLPQTTKRVLAETNFLFSFAGNITYKKNEYLREAIKIIPLERIVLETDCPFLPPQSIRGKRNEPSSVQEIAELIAEIKGLSFEEVANQTTQNAQKILELI